MPKFNTFLVANKVVEHHTRHEVIVRKTFTFTNIKKKPLKRFIQTKFQTTLVLDYFKN